MNVSFRWRPVVGALVSGILLAGASCRAVDLPGAQADGSVLLPNQWSLRPVGKQVPVGDFPANMVLHPSGKFAVALHCGYGRNELVSISLPAGKVVSRVTLEESFYGLAFSGDGSRVFASGAGDEVVHSFAFRDGLFSDARELRVRGVNERGVVAGLAVSGDGQRVYVAELYAMSVAAIDVTSGNAAWTLALAPGSVATDLTQIRLPPDPDLAAAEKRAAVQKEKIAADAPWPYAVVLDEPRHRLYVSLWGRAEVAVIDLETRAVTALWPTGAHPNEMRLTRSGSRLFVANANHNTVTVFDAGSGRVLETLSAAMHADDPPGSTPNSLALSPSEEFLFVANAGNNCVAVFDVDEPGKAHSLGFIPAGWYPTSVRVTPDGEHLLIANGKGLTSKSNRYGPQPGREAPAGLREYIGGLFQGTVGIVSLPKKGEPFSEKMQGWTTQAMKCSPAPPKPEVSTKRDRQNPIPTSIGGHSPIQYVLYVIKENRTYDQMLGDMPEGNGDAGLCLFGEAVTPNHHKLAREFVLLDNFYVDAEVSADGHEWSMGAYATDFVEKSWPLSYGHNSRSKYAYPAEGNFTIAGGAGGYLWDRAREAGVSFRNYGEFISAASSLDQPAKARVPSLEGHFDPWYRPWDLDYPDVKRTEHFAEELKRFEREGDMPRLQILRLGNDHTYGTSAGKLSPRAMVADNDLALGLFIEALSHSKFWPRTAVFVLEDDAQNGPDHVDAHRSPAFVISPYVKHRFRDSTMYSTCSMLRTMELILGLRPMSQFDAAAAPLFHSFQSKPDPRPFTHVPVTLDRTEKNLATTWGSDVSATMDFVKEDAADDVKLNEVIWRSVKGANHPMPAPVRAAFVRVRGDDDD